VQGLAFRSGSVIPFMKQTGIIKHNIARFQLHGHLIGHLGFGRITSGNKIPEVFARGILKAPSVTIDGKKIIEEGKILFG